MSLACFCCYCQGAFTSSLHDFFPPSEWRYLVLLSSKFFFGSFIKPIFTDHILFLKFVLDSLPGLDSSLRFIKQTVSLEFHDWNLDWCSFLNSFVTVPWILHCLHLQMPMAFILSSVRLLHRSDKVRVLLRNVIKFQWLHRTKLKCFFSASRRFVSMRKSYQHDCYTTRYYSFCDCASCSCPGSSSATTCDSICELTFQYLLHDSWLVVSS